MNLQNLVSSNAVYNLWANQQLLNWLSDKPEAQLNQEVSSSFPSMLKTLNHIWAIEEYWFSILTKKTEFENRYGVTDFKVDEIFEGLMNRSRLLADVIKSFTAEELTEKIKVVSPWFEAEQSRAAYIQHLMNHGTYHRGQVITIGRNAGLTDPPMTDYLFFNVMQVSQ